MFRTPERGSVWIHMYRVKKLFWPERNELKAKGWERWKRLLTPEKRMALQCPSMVSRWATRSIGLMSQGEGTGERGLLSRGGINRSSGRSLQGRCHRRGRGLRHRRHAEIPACR